MENQFQYSTPREHIWFLTEKATCGRKAIISRKLADWLLIRKETRKGYQKWKAGAEELLWGEFTADHFGDAIGLR